MHYQRVDAHPNRFVLEQYCANSVSTIVTDQIEEHLVYCSPCARLVSDIVRQHVRELQRTRLRPVATLE